MWSLSWSLFFIRHSKLLGPCTQPFFGFLALARQGRVSRFCDVPQLARLEWCLLVQLMYACSRVSGWCWHGSAPLMFSNEMIFLVLLCLDLGFFRRILVQDYNTIRFSIFLHDFPRYAQQRNLWYVLRHHRRYSIVVRASSNYFLESRCALALAFRRICLSRQNLRTCLLCARRCFYFRERLVCVIISSVKQPWLFAILSSGMWFPF